RVGPGPGTRDAGSGTAIQCTASPVRTPGTQPPMPQTAPPKARWIVLKVGGTSVSSRERWDTIGRLAQERAGLHGARVLVVVSALSGVTNALQAVADGTADAHTELAALKRRHREFAIELGLDADAVLGERLAALHALGEDARA